MSEDIKSVIETGLKDVSAQLEAKMAAHTSQIEKFGTAETKLTGDIDELSAKFKELQSAIIDLSQKGAGYSNDEGRPTIGEQFAKSAAFGEFMQGSREKVRIEVKNNTFADSTTTLPRNKDGVVAGSFAPQTIRAQIPSIAVQDLAISTLRELAWDNKAAETAQGVLKPESDITFEPYNVIVETVAHWTRVSKQLMADAPAITDYINTRMRNGLMDRVEAQLLLGNGTAPNLKGLTSAGNFVAFTPTAGANLVESINKAKYNRWAAGEVVDTVIVNPVDWAAMETLREGAGTGAYLYGTPGTTAGTSPFGINVVLSQYMPAGKFLIGNLRGSAMIYQRQGIAVEMAYQNDDFTRNMITIRAEERLGLGVERPMGLMYGDITAS